MIAHIELPMVAIYVHKLAKFGRLPLLEIKFPVFCQPDVHHSEERYLELLDSFNGVTETYHLTSLTVSPDATGQFHLVLLDRITWRYWTVSPKRHFIAQSFSCSSFHRLE